MVILLVEEDIFNIVTFFLQISNTYYVPLTEDLTKPPGLLPGQKAEYAQELSYYQWVPIILVFCAAMFAIPGKGRVLAHPLFTRVSITFSFIRFGIYIFVKTIFLKPIDEGHLKFIIGLLTDDISSLTSGVLR